MVVSSATQIAYEVLLESKSAMTFIDLWNIVKEKMNYNENQAMNKIASFHSALTLDKRFVLLPDNIWDLRKRHTFSESYISTSEYESSDEVITDEDFNKELELEYMDEE